MADVFLSYSRDDQEVARRYAAALERSGLSVWWDQALNPGETFDQITEERLRDAKAVVVLWSKKSVTSRWVRSEATQADRFGKLIPVSIETCDRPIQFELSHTADLSGWNGDTADSRWRSLLEGIQRLSGNREASSIPTVRNPTVKSTRTPIVIAAVALLLIVAAAAWFWRPRAPAIPAAQNPSIAVMPFDDMSASKDQTYFGDGVAEQIIEALSRIPGNSLKVIARTSSFALRGTGGDFRSISEKLAVNHLLTGSVRKSGDQVRVTAQLVNSADGSTLWTRQYTQPLNDIFKIQEDIARSVGEALQVSLGVGVGQQAGMTRDVEAYDLYLAGQAQSRDFLVDNQRHAINSFEQAVARDPKFALAWIELSDAYAGMAPLSTGAEKDWASKSDAAYATFERLLPDEEVTKVIRAGRAASHGHLVEAGKLFSTLPSHSFLLSDSYPFFLMGVGRYREALAMLQLLKEKDPLNVSVTFLLIHAYGNSGNAAASLAEAEHSYTMTGPASSLIIPGAITQALGLRDKALIRKWLDREMQRNPDQRSIDARVESLLDRPEEGRKLFRSWLSAKDAGSVSLLQASVWLAYFDDPEGSLLASRRAYDAGLMSPVMVGFGYRQMQNVRRLPAFKKFVQEIGLVDYWRQFGWSDYCRPAGKDDFECS